MKHYKHYFVGLEEVSGGYGFEASFVFKAELGTAEDTLYSILMDWRTDAVCLGEDSEAWFEATEVRYRVTDCKTISEEEYNILLPFVGGM